MNKHNFSAKNRQFIEMKQNHGDNSGVDKYVTYVKSLICLEILTSNTALAIYEKFKTPEYIFLRDCEY